MMNAVIMSNEEYDAIMKTIDKLQHDLSIMSWRADLNQTRADVLWNELNRPAIEESAAKGEQEYYSWCEQIAAKYEAIDEKKWLTSRARFYNNGVYDFCRENDISEDEAYAHRQYYDGVKFWSTSAVNSGLMYEMDTMEIEYNKSEGWSELFVHIPSEWACSKYNTTTTAWWIKHYDVHKGWDSNESKKAYNDLATLVGEREWP